MTPPLPPHPSPARGEGDQTVRFAMRFGASRSQLYDAQKTARARWEQTAGLWGDAPRREFEETVWVPLDEHVSAVLRAVDQLSVIFTQARHDCEFQP
jgi:hypothetical protein